MNDSSKKSLAQRLLGNVAKTGETSASSANIGTKDAGVLSGFSRIELDVIINQIKKLGGFTTDNILNVATKVTDGDIRKTKYLIDDIYGHSLMNQHNIKEYKNPVDQILASQEAILPIPQSQIGLHSKETPILKMLNEARYPEIGKNTLGAFYPAGSPSPNRAQTGELVYNVDRMSGLSPEEVTGTVGHETKHLVERINPNYMNYDFSILDVPNLTPQQKIERAFNEHFMEYPKSYMELEEGKKLINGEYRAPQASIPVITNDVDKQFNAGIKRKVYSDVRNSAPTNIDIENKLDPLGRAIINLKQQMMDAVSPSNLKSIKEANPGLTEKDLINEIESHYLNQIKLYESQFTKLQTATKRSENLDPEKLVSILPTNRIEETRQAIPEFTTKIKNAAAVAPLAGYQQSTDPRQGMKSAASSLGELYSSIRKPILEKTRQVGEFVADTVRPNIGLSEEAKQQERDLAGTVSEMTLDPTNLLSPGLGLAVGAADMASPEAPKEDEFNWLKSYMNRAK